MRRLVVGFLLSGMVCLMAPLSWTQGRGPSRRHAAHEAIVKFRSVTPVTIAEVSAENDLDRAQPLGGVPRLFRLHSRTKDAATLVGKLKSRADVEYAEPNFIVQALQNPNDPYFGQLWGLNNTGQGVGWFSLPGTPGADISALAAWDITTGSRNLAVAIVDTGIDYTHPDLAANVWSAPADFTVTLGGKTIRCAAGSHGINVLTGRCDPMDDHGHGTHVAGTIGATGNNGVGVVGVNWVTNLIGAKFLDAQGGGTEADAIDAIEFIVQVKALFASIGPDVRVLSNSWGGTDFSQGLLDEIRRTNDNDMLFVAAAGNSAASNETNPNYPASYDVANIVSVAATTNTDDLAYFSNYGANTVHLGAPGDSILSTYPGATYESLSGTSMATPHVSGAAALVLSVCPQNTSDLKSALLSNVDQLEALSQTTTSGGRLNAYRSLAGCSSGVVLSPGSVAFGTVSTGASASRTLTLTNLRSQAISISAITTSGSFTETSTCTATLPANSDCTITVVFEPSVSGYVSGVVTVNYDGPGSPATASVGGTGVVPTTLSPASLGFGNVPVGDRSVAKTVTLTNNQSTPLANIGIVTSGDFAQTSDCGTQLAPRAKCTVSVVFAPTALSSRTGKLTVTHDATNSPQTVSLSGYGIPQATLATPPYFGSVALGDTSAPKTVTLTNNQSSRALSISGISVSGDFAQSNDCGTQLAPLAKCTISMTFTPTALGSRTGTLTVTDSASNSPQSATLSGSGIAQATLSGAQYFGSVALGDTSAPKTVTLTNNQSAQALSISGITVSGDFAQSNNCGTQLAPLAKCTISVTFTPTALGSRTGTLTVTDSAGNSPQTAALSGNGVVQAALSAGLYFGGTVVGDTSAPKTATLTNNQSARALSISGITVSGDFAQSNDCGTQLAPLAKCMISVTFTPTALGSRTGTLTVTDSASNSPQTATLLGNGMAQATVSAAPYFGSVALGDTSPPKTVTLTNNQSSRALSISGITVSGDFAQSNDCGTQLAPLAKCTITLTFTPTAVGTRTGILSVIDSASNSPQTAVLSGNGMVQATLSTALYFGSVAIDNASPPKTMTLTNNQSSRSLSISGITVSGDFAQSNDCGTQVAPLAKCTITLTFTPTALGSRTGSLTVTDSASNSPQTAVLSGNGMVQATLSTPPYFGGVTPGETSAPKSVTLTNNQNSRALTISGITITGDFAQSNDCGTQLAPLAKCTISVTFTPTVLGNRTGVLTVTDSASNSPHTASVSGYGIAQATLSNALYFGNVAVGATAAPKVVTLTNNQNSQALSIGNITISGDFAQTNNCGGQLAPLAKCTISVTFTPTALGSRTGILTVNDSASNSPQTASVSGYGVAP